MSVDVVVPIKPQAVATTAVAPGLGKMQPYNVASGSLAPVLPALTGTRDGAVLVIEKDPADTSTNTVTVTCAGSDTFSSGSTSAALVAAGERLELQAATISTVRVWKVLRHTVSRSTMDTRYAPNALTVSNLVPGAILFADVTTGNYNTKARPTSRTDVRVYWTAPDSSHFPTNALTGDYVDIPAT